LAVIKASLQLPNRTNANLQIEEVDFEGAYRLSVGGASELGALAGVPPSIPNPILSAAAPAAKVSK
jgi:hypothetical protein